mmetsp:Transcript_7916/g.29535  ORF Transcript_7916/g.29535 Transcript_7916/m.29535 type:complete len:324 (-) Transcript_7916:122-1093(-)
MNSFCFEKTSICCLIFLASFTLHKLVNASSKFAVPFHHAHFSHNVQSSRRALQEAPPCNFPRERHRSLGYNHPLYFPLCRYFFVDCSSICTTDSVVSGAYHNASHHDGSGVVAYFLKMHCSIGWFFAAPTHIMRFSTQILTQMLFISLRLSCAKILPFCPVHIEISHYHTNQLEHFPIIYKTDYLELDFRKFTTFTNHACSLTHSFTPQVWPIVALRINCFFTLACTAFNALGFIQLFVFIPLWLASWVSPKIGSLTLLGWSIFCTFSTFFSVFGGWRTFGATVANVICLGFGVAMASVDIAETKRATGDYDNDFGSYEEDLG